MHALCRISLFTHIHLDIAYNQDRVIEVNVSTDASHTVRCQQCLRAVFQHVLCACCSCNSVASLFPRRLVSRPGTCKCQLHMALTTWLRA